jgi:hypothetical protein
VCRGIVLRVVLGAEDLRLTDRLQVPIESRGRNPKTSGVTFTHCSSGQYVCEKIISRSLAVLINESSVMKILRSLQGSRRE